MPRRRTASRRKNEDALFGLAIVAFLVVFIGAVIAIAVSSFWQSLTSGDPVAIAVLLVVVLAIGGASAFGTYRFLMRRERRFAAQRAFEREAYDAQQAAQRRAYEEARAEQEYANWLRSADMDALDRMTGIEFEHALAHLFTDLGYGAVVTQASHDFGADLVLSRGGQSVVVQAKRYVGTLGLEAVQQASAARMHYGAVRAIVVTTSDFTTPARTLAQTTGVELWSRQRLNEELASVAERRGSRPTADVATVSARNGEHIASRKLDPLFAQAARAVAAQGSASVSLVQQIFNLDYTRASRIVDQLTDHRVIGAYRGSMSRSVLMNLPDVDDLLERLGIE